MGHLSGCLVLRKSVTEDDARGQKRKRRDDVEEADTLQELASILGWN